jgi:anti-sigma regulatory factor (Ser/Thr protein kinase)
MTVTDHGVPFDPTAAPAPDITLPAEERSIGGLGIFLTRTLMDGFRYERVGGTNVLTLEKKL